MELDIIFNLLDARPAWLAPFPVVLSVEYPIRTPNGRRGRGDLLLCDGARRRFLVVEVKRHTKRNSYLIAQMHRYRQAVKLRHPAAAVDAAAVAGGCLLTYVRDEDFQAYRPKLVWKSTL